MSDLRQLSSPQPSSLLFASHLGNLIRKSTHHLSLWHHGNFKPYRSGWQKGLSRLYPLTTIKIPSRQHLPHCGSRRAKLKLFFSVNPFAIYYASNEFYFTFICTCVLFVLTSINSWGKGRLLPSVQQRKLGIQTKEWSLERCRLKPTGGTTTAYLPTYNYSLLEWLKF